MACRLPRVGPRPSSYPTALRRPKQPKTSGFRDSGRWWRWVLFILILTSVNINKHVYVSLLSILLQHPIIPWVLCWIFTVCFLTCLIINDLKNLSLTVELLTPFGYKNHLLFNTWIMWRTAASHLNSCEFKLSKIVSTSCVCGFLLIGLASGLSFPRWHLMWSVCVLISWETLKVLRHWTEFMVNI